MTYNEADKVIKDNIRGLDKYVMGENPPHRLLGWIIAPENRDTRIEEVIFNRCVLNEENNELVLVDLNLYNEYLKPFVVILMGGENVIMPLESYIAMPGKDE